MDLSKLDMREGADDGRWLQLTHPVTQELLWDDEKKKTGPVRIRLLGADSKKHRSKEYAARNRRLKQMGRGGKRGGLMAGVTAEGLEEDATEVMVACTLGWENIQLAGQPLEFTPDAARSLYSEHEWIREQVDEFIADRANFLGEA